MSCARGEQRTESLMRECCIYSFSSYILTRVKIKLKRQPSLSLLLKKREEAKISSLFVRRARSLLESALIGREEHDDAVVKVVGEEEEEVEQKVRVRRRAERINNNNKNKHVVARDD